MKQPTTCWKQNIEAGPFLAALKALGGATAQGDLGDLRIALAPDAMPLPSGAPWPAAWLLPLADVQMVRLAANVPGELLWLSPRPPRSVAGALLEDYCGAWWDGTGAHVKLGTEAERYFLPAGSPAIGSLETLALIVALRWTGQSPLQVQSHLRPGSTPEIVPVFVVTPSISQLVTA